MIASLFSHFPRMTALVVGTASALGFAPLGLWPVTLIALGVLMHLVSRTTTAKRAFLLGWLFGLGHFTLSLHWIATAFTYQAAMPPILGWVAVPLVSLYLALYPALACAVAWWVTTKLSKGVSPLPFRGGAGGGVSPDSAALKDRPHPNPSPEGEGLMSGSGPEGEGLMSGADLEEKGQNVPFTFLFAAAWIVTEWLRSWVFTGFAWNPLAAVWSVDSNGPPLIRVIGTYGASGLTILIVGVLRQFWLSMKSKTSIPKYKEWGTRAIVFFLALGPILFPLGLLDRWSATNADYQSPRTPVTIVQPNIEQGDKWDLAQRLDNFERLAALSRTTDPATPRLLLWPEAAVPDYLEDSTPPDWTMEDPARVRARLAALLGPDDVLLTGAVKLEPNADGSDIVGARNSVFTLGAAGQLGPRYDKAHLVPYGEYLPMRTILEPLGLSRLAPGAVDFWAGPGARSIDLGRFGKVGIQICYEIIFSGQVVDRANRPAFIFNPSNDAWFGAWGPPQHLAQARLRAIEEGLPVVRATPTGISAIIDADGRIAESLPMHRAGRIDASLPPPHAPTLFARYGNALPLAFAIILGMLSVAFGRRRRYSAAT